MPRTYLLVSLALAGFGTAAVAEISAQDLIDQYRADGYRWVEVTVGPNHIEVEAIRGAIEVETVYDRATGAVLSTETQTARMRDRNRSGAEIETTSAVSLLDDDRHAMRRAHDDCDDD